MIADARSIISSMQHHAAKLLILGMAMVMLSIPMAASAQSIPGVTQTFYAYFSPDVSTQLMLGHLEAEDPSLAGEMVSPRYADEFLSGFTIFTNYDFAADLEAAYIDQVDEAEEYMVFAGDLDSHDGVKPGYVIMLSASSQVFLLVAYQDVAEDLFALAAQTIDEAAAPETFGEFTRVDLDDVGSALQEDASDQQNSNAESTGVEFCFIEPSFEAFDTNGDGAVTVAEMEVWTDAVPEVVDAIANMNANGYDSIRYVGC